MKSEDHTLSLFSGFGIKLSLTAWLAVLGFDFFLHAGLLAGIYTRESPFLLTPMEAFRRIPVGYLSFLILTTFLVWLALQLHIHSAKEGFRLGLILGLVMWSSLGLGLYSITTGEPLLLIAWAAGQSLELAYAGALIGLSLRQGKLRNAFLTALGSTLVLVIVTILLQSLGIFHSTRL